MKRLTFIPINAAQKPMRKRRHRSISRFPKLVNSCPCFILGVGRGQAKGYHVLVGAHVSPVMAPFLSTALGKRFPKPTQRWKKKTRMGSGTCVSGAATYSWGTSETSRAQRGRWTPTAGYTRTTWASWILTSSSMSWGTITVRNAHHMAGSTS